MSGYARKTGDAQAAQVVTLLNQLGDRMVRSERERIAVREEIENTREILSNLENRAEKAERIFLTMQDNISKKESMADALIERQNNLERLYRDSAERLKRAEALTGQIEEAIALQNRLARRLEKTAQDKVRMMTKIERIEAAVEETRQSLNSGKLVGITIPQGPANDAVQGVGSAQVPWWKAMNTKARIATVGSLLIAGLLGGVAISQLLIHWPQAPVTAVPSTEVATTTGDNIYVSPYGTAPASLPTIISTHEEDLAPYGEDAMNAAMDTDPDAVAAALNEIEPSISAEIPNIAKDVEAASLPETLVQPASLPAADVAKDIPAPVVVAPRAQINTSENASVDEFVRTQSKSATPLVERIEADAKLPDAIKAIEKKAFEGIPEAQHDLAAIYTAGHGGVAVDYKRAALWFTEAAGNGIANARYNLGVLYHQGLGVERDIGKAIGWYRAAAALGHPEADYNLGIAEIEGIGTEYNPRRAAKSFERAARGGVMEAAYNLGLIHENGLLGDPDMNEAVFWYSTAADYSPEARVALNHVTKALSLKKTDIDRIVREYGAVYNLSGTGPAKKAAAPTPVETTSVASLTAQDQLPPEASGDPASLARVIPPLSSADSRNLLNSVRNDQAMIAQIQEQLIRFGLYPGPADGLGGPQTEDAIRSYQSRNKLAVTGKPSEELLVRMMGTELSASASMPQD